MTATAPAARKDVKNDILSLFATKSPTNFQSNSIHQTSNLNDLNGFNHQFGNLNVSNPSSQPWSQTGNLGNQISSSNGFPMMNNNQTTSTFNQTNTNTNNNNNSSNLFDTLSDPWSSNNQSNQNDGFGNFSVASKPNHNSSSNGKDAFSDIWN
ncbi:uncharacterized protein MELLADRAFT_74201 [Melampsora larici-populina 98AG31]|uniref:Uncharacterized protein n=1 Tax=Melampsora larici-populina (strain 98AG31 / pathotype 3-4-7) TaxID=747676 RepID=F4R9W7_MELLP|nr:uncharacterized protein MELLADRAFT_74201 [Melampsora larici-populina 98AG31]EGG10601.1 hypothetical protein MELLADRAFT_74201 [Melampsora larici-populina 98AG31]